VQGFSSGKGQAAIQSSQKMAEAVVRYLVLQHEVPVYRIFTVGMGDAPMKAATPTTGETTAQQRKRLRGGLVEIALLRNNLSELESAQAGAAPASPSGQESATPSTTANPNMQQEQVPPNAPAGAQHPKVESQTPPKEQAPVAPPK
jgi:hypothetical protein